MANSKESSSANTAWGGRFCDSPDRLVAAYTESQSHDRALYHEDIRGSIAHAKMCAIQGIIPAEEAEILIKSLKKIEQEIEEGSFKWQESLEDVHMNIESRLVELAGETGKKLHTGRSRNDQVGLDFRLFIYGRLQEWRRECVSLCRIFADIARKNIDAIMPGYTHMQSAQPVSLAQHMLAYAGMFKRDVSRIADTLERIAVSPLGAAALAGSTFPLNPEMVAREVGFNKIYANSMDAVSDRDFALEALFIASVIMMHISRLCEEIVIWSNPAFGFIRLPDKFATGSSIMPQKKNPDVAELARGKTGRVYGHLIGLLTVMKGLPLAYNRDMQEDKEGFFDADKTVSSSLAVMGAMIPQLEFDREKMKAACQQGYLNATELADYLASRSIPFRRAHHITGKIVALAEKKGLPLEKMPLADFQSIEPTIQDDVYKYLDYATAVSRRETPGGTGPKSIARQLKDLDAWLRNTAQ